ncbi:MULTISPECIES: tetratricopeptide repeat protein [unclassified Pasteurella]|uniref:SEL1-like repeat protein n=1 Tax=unclassified Pasteurella TaxID=2621516 RepID=UPI001074018A|nr:sel1 repeat family protein [Pasteurella sp. 19428wF3_WM03]TFU49454.1 sel1 repeat family protein [Pasteurella sp. WM03]
MNKYFLLVLLFSNTIYADDIKCENIINKYQFNNSKEDSFKLGLEYRSKYFSAEKQLEAYCLIVNSQKLGNIDAEAVLAQFYESGDIVKKDLKKAVEMTENAVKKGSSLALSNLGSYYLHGYAVPKDFEKSVFYYQKAIKKGYSFAKIGLGSMYFWGVGVPQDIEKAIALTREAALDTNQFGYDLAMVNLGLYYGFIGNQTEEINWYKKAAELYQPQALENLSYVYATEPKVANLDKSLFWINKAIERDNPQAYMKLGNYYADGTIVYPKDEKKAFELYQKAAELNSPQAQHNLGNWYLTGRYIQKNEKEAIKWYEKAADAENIYSINMLYQIYTEGAESIPKNEEKAQYWFNKAKEQGITLK